MSVLCQCYKLRYPENGFAHETSRAILHYGGYACWDEPFSSAEDEYCVTFDDETTLTIFKTDNSQVIINGIFGIESYLAALYNLSEKHNPVIIGQQAQLRHEIDSLFKMGCSVKYCNEEHRETTEFEFKQFAKQFIEAHSLVLWRNGLRGFYFDTSPTYVDVALMTTIKRLMIILAPISEELYKLIGPEEAPELHKVVRAVAALPKIKEYAKTLDDALEVDMEKLVEKAKEVEEVEEVEELEKNNKADPDCNSVEDK
ncbi:hypothetical protein LPJ66_002844 [Kickxella alabastrina]|uniref:Uncharacterized protein n=1 Tax=Kickxella alabastrina TaxID=61397 RepID=A0ACC1IPE1_9FUNG|nr:hypothetical protein LPJ66_002844 [Kickxella alabastrina]